MAGEQSASGWQADGNQKSHAFRLAVSDWAATTRHLLTKYGGCKEVVNAAATSWQSKLSEMVGDHSMTTQ